MNRLPLAALFLAASCASAQSPGSVRLADGTLVACERVERFLDRAIEEGRTSGLSFALVNDGEIVMHYHAGLADRESERPVTERTLFEGASLSKPLFGALVISLASEGVIDLDEPLLDHWPHPDLRALPGSETITARMVLSHASGLPNWRRYEPNEELSLAFEPGGGFLYSGEGYQILAETLMHTLGVDDEGLDRIFERRFLRPVGADATSFVQTRRELRRKAVGYDDGSTVADDPVIRKYYTPAYEGGEFWAPHSVHTNAAAYAEVVLGLTEEETLNEEEADLFFAPQERPVPQEPGLTQSDQALGFQVYELPFGRFYGHGGNTRGFTNLAAIDRDGSWGFVLLTNEGWANDLMEETAFFLTGLTAE